MIAVNRNIFLLAFVADHGQIKLGHFVQKHGVILVVWADQHLMLVESPGVSDSDVLLLL